MKLSSKKDGENIKAILHSESTEDALGMMEFYLGGFEITSQRDKVLLENLAEKDKQIEKLKSRVNDLEPYIDVICQDIACNFYGDPGKKITCIKRVRDVSKWGLKECKNFVEKIWSHLDKEDNKSCASYKSLYDQFESHNEIYSPADEF